MRILALFVKRELVSMRKKGLCEIKILNSYGIRNQMNESRSLVPKFHPERKDINSYFQREGTS